MSAAKHTPGAWQAREWSCHAKTTVAVDDPSWGVTGVRVVAECETPQDARLIAAAPDLLEALQRCQLELRQLTYKDDQITRALDAAYRALNKATGEAA